MLHVWLIEGTKLILNVEQILKVPELAKIYNDWHDNKELMYKIFRFIDCYADEDGYIRRNGLTEMGAFKYAIDVSGLPEDFRPTKDVAVAIDWLNEHNINFVGEMFFNSIEAIQSAKDLVKVMNKNLRDSLKKDAFSSEEISNMLGYVNQITKLASGLPKLIEDLKNTEEAYQKSKLKKTVVRGGKEMAKSMDPHNTIDNGGTSTIDVID
ncbi:MAG: hypothetical protein HDQ88_05025 [Clostridia bacterium]|nr:hypothetical protein [Clostridia bacterium]